MKKKISLLLVGSFLWTQVYLPEAYSGPAEVVPLADKKVILEELIPKELGQLRKVHFPLPLDQELYRQEGLKAALDRIIHRDSPVVVLIEDAHSSVEAQMNIANLIEFIRINWHIDLLALEGAEGDAPLAEINASPMSEEKGEVLDFYLRQALLSGPEYEALRSPESYKVRGVENMEVYESDRKIYLDVAGKRYEIDQILDTTEARLDKEKERYYSPEFLTFDRKERNFSRNPSRYLSSFVPYLVREAGRVGLKPSESSSLPLVVRVLADSQNISLEGLKKEAAQFRSSERKFGREIRMLEKRFLPRGFDFDFAVTGPPPRIPHFFLYRFPALRAYLDLAEMRYQIDPVQMFSEITDFVLETKKLLGKSPKELELDKRGRDLELLRRILHLEAKREDVTSAGGIRELAKELDLLDPYERAALFYELAVKRDEILALNTLQAISEVASSPKAAILVAGGFHAAGIQTVLENSKVNYLVITPQFDSNLSDDRLYQMRLKDDLTLVGSHIASPKRIMDRAFLEEIERSAQNRGRGMDMRRAVTDAQKRRREDIARIATARILRLTQKSDIPALVPADKVQAASLGNADETYADLEKTILDLYRQGPLEGREDLIQKLKRKAVRTAEFVEVLADEAGLDLEAREYLKIAALTGDLGKGSSGEKLNLHYSTLRKSEMTLTQQKNVEAFVDDGFQILKRYDVRIPDVSQLLVRAVYQKNEQVKKILDSAGLTQATLLLKLSSQFSALISVTPYVKDVEIKKDQDIALWLKELELRGEITPEIRKMATRVFRGILLNFQRSTDNPSYISSFLDPGVSKPLFHDPIVRLAKFRDLSMAALAPILETGPAIVREGLEKRLGQWTEISDAEKERILAKFPVQFFEEMMAAYKKGDKEKQIDFLIRYENVLKEFGESNDLVFKKLREKSLTKRGSVRTKGKGLKHFVIAEDFSPIRQYLEAKVLKQNPTAQIISGPSGEEVLDVLRRQIDKDPSYAPDLVLTDIEMLDKDRKPLMSGWEFSQKVKQMFPRVMVLAESSVPYPIKAEVEGAISKYDLLYLEHVLDLYEKELMSRREIKGESLGAAPAQPVWSREEVLAVAQKNMDASPRPAYLFLPSSLLGKVQPGSVSAALKNPNIHLEILWDTAASPAERIEHLRSLGWDVLTKEKNFHSNIADRKLDSLKSLAEKAAYRSKTLEEKGISAKQIGLLKPAALETNIPGVLSLKEGAPYPVFLLLYLLQIEGSPAHDLLDIFSFDPKRGDFTAFLDEELERLLAAHFALQATKRAA